MEVINRNKDVEFLGRVYQDINAIEVSMTDSFQTLMDRFYGVMGKWEICQGTWTENGRCVSNPEWCICWNVFKSLLESKFVFMGLLSEPPKHLLAYGEEPKRKYDTEEE